jgi:fructuronate reductase
VSILNGDAIRNLPEGVGRPAYDRARLATGILHFGPGAFHRAHQADYIDRLLAHDPRWGIAAVSLRSAGTVDALKRQDGLYTLAILDAAPAFRTLGAHTRFFGPGEAAKVRSELISPDLKIVSSTVTEKGYCLAVDGTLDFDHPDILNDLGKPDEPESLIGWLTLGLGDRRAAGLPPFTPLCCDNMIANGRKLGAAVAAFARRLDPGLGDWIAGEVRFPNSMVDSITPATDEGTRRQVQEAIGVLDLIPVRREAYAAWIIEDVLPFDGPDFKSAGAVLTDDVAAYELAKLRILNGAHSSLAYLGLLIGHETVADAMRDGSLARFIERLIVEDIIPSLTPSFDLHRYAGEIIKRFRNPSIGHKLSQIAWDGSQKLPYRLLDTIGDALEAGRTVERLAVPVAAWMLFVRRQALAGIEIVDPLGDRLAEIGRGSDPVGGLLGLQQVFPDPLARSPHFRAALDRAVSAMRTAGPRALIGDAE